MPRDSVTVIRMYLCRESPSGKAILFVDAPRKAEVKREEWIPRSLIDRLTKLGKGVGHDYTECELELPSWAVQQKNLGAFEK
jgi:hypothetical protein